HNGPDHLRFGGVAGSGIGRQRAASTIAKIPRRIASGRVGHASISRPKSGSAATAPSTAESAFGAPTAPDSAPPVWEFASFPVEFRSCSSPFGVMTNWSVARRPFSVPGPYRDPTDDGQPTPAQFVIRHSAPAALSAPAPRA